MVQWKHLIYVLFSVLESAVWDSLHTHIYTGFAGVVQKIVFSPKLPHNYYDVS